jgi:hypothetical protein
MRMGRVRREHESTPSPGRELILAHQPSHTVAADLLPGRTQLAVNAGAPVFAAAELVSRADVDEEPAIFDDAS